MARHVCNGNAGLQQRPLYSQVEQAELETYDNVAAGKYTVGLGQVRFVAVLLPNNFCAPALSVGNALEFRCCRRVWPSTRIRRMWCLLP